MIADESILLGSSKVRTRRSEAGALWRVSLNAPPDNVLDDCMVEELTKLFQMAAEEPKLKAVILSAEGLNFSLGASVEQCQAGQAEPMLVKFHGLFRTIAAAGVPVIAAVRGKCFGGGLELAAFCQRVFVHPDASLAQPEIALGIFAPVASAILADRIGRAGADDLLLTGRVVDAKEAKALGLADEIKRETEGRAQDWALQHLMPRSASSLRFAARAARCEFMHRFDRTLDELRQLYLGPLMASADAREGIASCIEGRKPTWADD